MKNKKARQLWSKGEAVDALMHQLTVGNDYLLDLQLVRADCLGSLAHAAMLGKVGLLTNAETKKLVQGLRELSKLHAKGQFQILPEQEDCHTAIEAFLTEALGDVGKRIHVARSRNDQVAMALRIYLRASFFALVERLYELLDTLALRHAELQDILMPGYTHFQQAMPSSAGLWIHSLFEGLLQQLVCAPSILQRLNISPLGSGAGFGTSLPIDRREVARLLNFEGVQRSVIDVNNSRGRYEILLGRWLLDIGAVLEKFACDFMIFSTSEFAFCSLPRELTTGSSIMPQKRNPDIVELLRGKVSQLRAALHEVELVSSKLPSSYHRDHQYTKEPTLRLIGLAHEMLQMATLICGRFTLNRERCQAAMTPELYATYAANRLVASGTPFRSAYAEVAKLVTTGSLQVDILRPDFEPVQREMKKGMRQAQSECQRSWRQLSAEISSIRRAEAKLLQEPAF